MTHSTRFVDTLLTHSVKGTSFVLSSNQQMQVPYEHKTKFTPEEIKNLKANPYTLRVTEDSISYTLAFKEEFWNLSLQGYTGTAVFRKLGYNTEVIGFERIHNTTKRIRRDVSS